MNEALFPMAEYWWFYAGFTALVLGLLALDLGVFHREAHEVRFREAAAWTVVWVALGLAFAGGLYLYSSWAFAGDARLLAVPGFDAAAAARRVTLEFLTGYVVEKALSVDNIFIFVVIFSYFAIPPRYQHRVLFYGIAGALVFRAIFIAAGSALMQYHLVLVLFGIFLIVTGFKMAFASERKIDPDKNLLVRVFRKIVPVTPRLHGSSFFVRENGLVHATPLALALVFVEATDIVFAVDSVPAIFALTEEPLVVYTSNVFAILGLRSMYFMLAGAVDKFHMLKYGLAAVLVFVGLKMAWLNDLFGGKFPISVSLAVIFGLVGASVAASLLFPAKPARGEGTGPSDRADAADRPDSSAGEDPTDRPKSA
jgi:tellurite resistance protein TerC